MLPLCFVAAPSRLVITMPMSLANTRSLSKCRRLRELLLCTLPEKILEKGSLDQVGVHVCTHVLWVTLFPHQEHVLMCFVATHKDSTASSLSLATQRPQL